MSELIQIQNEEVKPRIVCMHCKQEIAIDIDPFKKDVTKILRDNCPKCNKEIVVGIMILAHKDLRSLLGSLQVIIETIDSQNQILGGRRVQ